MMLTPAALVAISIFAITYICIATEKVDKTAAALLGAAIVVSLGVVPYEVALHAVDLNVVLLLVGMMVPPAPPVQPDRLQSMVVLLRHLPLADSRAISSCGLDILYDLVLLVAVQRSSLTSPLEVVRKKTIGPDLSPVLPSADFPLRFLVCWHPCR